MLPHHRRPVLDPFCCRHSVMVMIYVIGLAFAEFCRLLLLLLSVVALRVYIAQQDCWLLLPSISAAVQLPCRSLALLYIVRFLMLNDLVHGSS